MAQGKKEKEKEKAECSWEDVGAQLGIFDKR